MAFFVGAQGSLHLWSNFLVCKIILKSLFLRHSNCLSAKKKKPREETEFSRNKYLSNYIHFSVFIANKIIFEIFDLQAGIKFQVHSIIMLLR